MAIVRLTDIVSTMKDKWTYGDKFFGYTDEFNDNHNTQYPSLLITPPNSVYPEVTPRNGWEEYSFEVYFSDLYNRTDQANESIEQRWDNLQDLANEWLDMFLKSYMGTQAHKTTISYLMDGSLTIERKKEVANDQLLQLKMNFGFKIFSKCFAPVSNYPNQISGLTSWLRADSNVTFSIPTKKVSAIGDGSGNANGVAQLSSSGQPLRYTYGGGASDKTRIKFNGSTDELESVNNSPINTDLTVFTVAQATPVTPAFENKYSTRFLGYTEFVTCGNPAGGSGGQLFSFNDGAGTDKPFSLNVWANNDPTQPWRGWLEKWEANNKEYSFNPGYSNGQIVFRIFDNATGGLIQAKVTPSQQKGEWELYTATYDGSGTAAGMRIYINGVESQDAPSTVGTYNSMQQTTSNLDLGQGNTNPYVGLLDECSVYDKQLSNAEVIEIYNSKNPNDLTALTSSSSNLIGWWRMGDGAVFPTIPDDSTNSNDATMTNMSASSIIDFSPNSEEGSYFSYEFGNVELCLGSSSERIYCHVNDGAGAAGEWNARRISNGDSSKYHISTMKLDSATANLSLQYNNAETMSSTMSGYNPSQTYNSAKFKIGSGTHLGYLDGNIQEIIIYNRALSTSEISKIQDYLNKKYKIY